MEFIDRFQIVVRLREMRDDFSALKIATPILKTPSLKTARLRGGARV